MDALKVVTSDHEARQDRESHEDVRYHGLVWVQCSAARILREKNLEVVPDRVLVRVQDPLVWATQVAAALQEDHEVPRMLNPSTDKEVEVEEEISLAQNEIELDSATLQICPDYRILWVELVSVVIEAEVQVEDSLLAQTVIELGCVILRICPIYQV